LVANGHDHLIVDDYGSSPYRSQLFGAAPPFEAVLEVHLKHRDQTLGVIYVEDKVGRKFTEDDVYLLKLFADPVAIALSNADMLDKEKKAEFLLAASDAVSQARSATEGLEHLAGLIAKSVQASFCRILLTYEQDSILVVKAGDSHTSAFKELLP